MDSKKPPDQSDFQIRAFATALATASIVEAIKRFAAGDNWVSAILFVFGFFILLVAVYWNSIVKAWPKNILRKHSSLLVFLIFPLIAAIAIQSGGLIEKLRLKTLPASTNDSTPEIAQQQSALATSEQPHSPSELVLPKFGSGRSSTIDGPELPLQSAPPSGLALSGLPSKDITAASPDFLRALVKDKYGEAKNEAASPFIGRWMRVAGFVDTSGFSYSKSSGFLATFSEKPNDFRYNFMISLDENMREYVAQIKNGQELHLLCQIVHIGELYITLRHCDPHI